jgi:hypothetical protein
MLAPVEEPLLPPPGTFTVTAFVAAVAVTPAPVKLKLVTPDVSSVPSSETEMLLPVPAAPVGPVGPAVVEAAPVGPVGPVPPLLPVGPVAPTLPATPMFHEVYVPEPPVASEVMISVVPLKEVIIPST